MSIKFNYLCISYYSIEKDKIAIFGYAQPSIKHIKAFIKKGKPKNFPVWNKIANEENYISDSLLLIGEWWNHTNSIGIHPTWIRPGSYQGLNRVLPKSHQSLSNTFLPIDFFLLYKFIHNGYLSKFKIIVKSNNLFYQPVGIWI